ncbi:pyrimidine 5'-nucleotidase [Methylobacillus flagellatus]|uniref:pyrimidine 5'-nucleotidase n=1 Tax=Methylobacillus flagellatus TaxID=405 RepID=UPI002854025B|nr:pyrimidine 5'-nucleotidase [Methylobacillus flagellatus]MDR5172357.1 pyrimidine 5'-nucleotidase [Methylobacillus flagellatus]
MSHKVWIFDLDNTLHDADAEIFPHLHIEMTRYIMNELSLEEEAACLLRQHYWRIYGATLKGLMRHHRVHPHHFLQTTHQLDDLPKMVRSVKRLRHTLQQLSGRKVVFTNAPMSYAERVLKLLAIDDLFDQVFSVESCGFHPKPAMRGFQHLLQALKVSAGSCILLEDSLPALMTAKRLGMKTIHVSARPRRASYVDARISSVLELPHTWIYKTYNNAEHRQQPGT